MINDTLNFLTWAAICACLWLVPLPSHAATISPVDALAAMYGAMILAVAFIIAVALHVSRRPS